MSFRFCPWPLRAALLSAALACLCWPARAEAGKSVSAEIAPGTIHLGETATYTLTFQHAGRPSLTLPEVPGLAIVGTQTSSFTTITDTGTSSVAQIAFSLAAEHPGSFTFPAFDVSTPDGGSIHVPALHLQVLPGNETAPQSAAPAPATPVIGPPAPNPALAPQPQPQPLPIPAGPVVMPPNGPPTPNGTDAAGTNPDGSQAAPPTPATIAPLGPDGTPAKVFIVITPETTRAFVGQAVLLRIEFYIRGDSDYQQNSLPTIKGSDFLMTQLSVRPKEESYLDGGTTPYRRETWLTAITATRAGDFPFQMERDTYWTKEPDSAASNPFPAFFHTKPELEHQLVGSNSFTLLIKPLPLAGRPPSFSGAIGQFRATAEVAPDHLTLGEPASLHFTISGKGNFDYVKCPALAASDLWKRYQPQARTTYDDEAHTLGTKEFEQAIIPRQAGTFPPPAATFSYFDPETERYVSTPLPLPTIQVFGGAAAPLAANAATAPDGAIATANLPPAAATGMAPAREQIGQVETDLRPIFWRRWFWSIQALLIALIVGGLVAGQVPSWLQRRVAARRRKRETERQQHRQKASLQEALAQGDSAEFFSQAHALVQAQVGKAWHLPPGAIDLETISAHDPHLAEMLDLLFAEADRARYSGRPLSAGRLAEWQERWPQIEQALPQPSESLATAVATK